MSKSEPSPAAAINSTRQADAPHHPAYKSISSFSCPVLSQQALVCEVAKFTCPTSAFTDGETESHSRAMTHLSLHAGWGLEEITWRILQTGTHPHLRICFFCFVPGGQDRGARESHFLSTFPC